MIIDDDAKKIIKKIVCYEKKKLLCMNALENKYPKLKKPIMILNEGWTWDMYFRGTTREINIEEIEAVVLTALTNKIHKVDYKESMIKLSDLRKI